MKTWFLSLSFFLVLSVTCLAQIPLGFEIQLHENTPLSSNNLMFVKDSSVFMIREEGLEEFQANRNHPVYHWGGHYGIRAVVPDTNGRYAYLTSGSFIGRFNAISQKYVNVFNLNGMYLNDIGVAPDGKIYAVPNYGAVKLCVLDGINWQQFNFQIAFNTFRNVKVANDTLIFLSCSDNQIYSFHNGVLDTLASNIPAYDIKAWDADVAGNLWVALENDLYHFSQGTTTIYHSADLPFNSDKFYHVRIGTNGHVWVAGDSQHLYEFNQTSWQVINLPNWFEVQDFALNQANEPWVKAKNGSESYLEMRKNGAWIQKPMPYLPFFNPKTIGWYNYFFGYANGLFATDEGWFDVNLATLNIVGFHDSINMPYANEVTCFANGSTTYPAFGTHHGVQNLNGFDNNILPSQNITTMFADNGSYYIGTDKGLMVYNGVFYSLFDTTNTPLPSNYITCLVLPSAEIYCGSQNGLLVGTDKGLAVYKNGSWKSYSGANISVGDFYVTGIIPACYDSTMVVSTLGKGLIKIYPSGAYTLENTANGMILDDTLYYAKIIQLADCGSFWVFGTKHHGIMSQSTFFGPGYQYDTVSVYPQGFHSSQLITGNFFYITNADSSIRIMSPCGSVSLSQKEKETFRCYQQEQHLQVEIPSEIDGEAFLTVFDITGKALLSTKVQPSQKEIQVNISGYSPGLYLVSLKTQSEIFSQKVVLMR